MITLIDALISGWPDNEWSISGTNEQYSSLVWKSNVTTKPSEEEIQTKIAELEAAEPLRQLREQRNQLLQQSDWMANSDVTMSEEWRVYRQALRDLPNTQTPSLDENGQLTNITWPEKPQ
jgi:hypothetical protein